MIIKMDQVGDAVRFPVYVQPRASRSEIVGEHNGALKVRVAAPPVEGEANDELVRFLAKLLGVPAGAVSLVTGESGRRKRVEVRGLTAAVVNERLRAG